MAALATKEELLAISGIRLVIQRPLTRPSLMSTISPSTVTHITPATDAITDHTMTELPDPQGAHLEADM
jgi:hypothetical protein